MFSGIFYLYFSVGYAIILKELPRRSAGVV